MTNLKVKQIIARLKDRFEAHLDLSGVSQKDAERETKILTRCLTAFAIQHLTGCDAATAAGAVWDGPDDNGIDGAFFDLSESRVLLVQSKWINAGAGEPAAKDIAVFANGNRDLVEGESDNFAERLQQKFTEVSQAVMTPGVTIHAVVISTGASEMASHATANLDRVLKELNGGDPDQDLATKEVLGLGELYPALAVDAQSDKIAIDANILDWSYVATPYAAYFGVVDGLQLKEWWSVYGRRLVAKNIRHALGATEVNNQIKHTAQTAPEHFWYFNNGITLIADEVVKAPAAAASRSSGNFQFRAASIVNGAQTVSSLARVENDESLGRVRVPVRVIVLKNAPAGFVGEVTRTNNFQNRVEGRDFVAQDPEQSRLQMEMGMEGIDYQFLRSEGFVASDKSCDLVEVATSLACASGDSALAVAVKTGIGRFFNDLSKPPYRAIFNPSTSGARAFNAVVVQRAIDQWIEEKKRVTRRSGYSWGVLVHGNRILSAAVFRSIGPDVLSQSIAEFRAGFSKLNINKVCEKSYSKMVPTLENNYAGKFLAVLFKNPAMSKAVLDTASKG